MNQIASKCSGPFKVSFELLSGKANPLGAELSELGCNFAVYSHEATKIELCLFDEGGDEVTRFELPQRKGKHWFAFIKGVTAGQRYGYRVYGDNHPESGALFDPDKLLIDPYAKSLSHALVWDLELYQGDSQQMMAKSVVVSAHFDWQATPKPEISEDKTLLYELHVKGFTQLHPDIPVQYRGTYLGLCQPVVIEYLKNLGITSVQLMPVASFMAEPWLKERGLTNYWGYNPVNFFAPDPRYAVNNAVSEFKTMVRELHKANIEVILDVVFNHTAEGGFGGPLLSFKGLDNKNYYSFELDAGRADYSSYSNNTGCGNSFNLDYPWALKLALDALRYWVTEMQVDGFRFDLAVSLAREGNEFDPYGAFFKAVMQDPVLSQVKLIAEPWDIGPAGYRLGQFPSHWFECNDRYRDTVRAFWRGDRGQIAELATRLLGSRDIFPKNHRSIHSSVNYICYHDGFTLHDLVSYDQRRNLANGEENRDGHGHNLSANYGREGETFSVEVNRIRQQQKRNLIATLLLSQGTPHFLAGDEMGRTQLGNNNAYCQDNGISWLNWQLTETDSSLLAFTRKMIALRRESNVFSRLSLDDDKFYGGEQSDLVHWYHPDGNSMLEEDWSTGYAQVLAIELKEHIDHGERWFLVLNASSKSIQCRLPFLKSYKHWELMLNTAADQSIGQNFMGKDIEVAGRAMLLMSSYL